MSRAIHNALIYTVLNLAQKALGFLVLPLYLWFLSPEEYGLVSYYMTLSVTIGVFFHMGLNATIVRFFFDQRASDEPGYHKKLYGTLLTVYVGISIIFSLIFFLGKSWIVFPFINIAEKTPYYEIALLFVVAFPYFEFYQRILQARQEGQKFAKITFLYFILQITLSIVLLVVFKLGALSLLIGRAGVELLFAGYSIYKIIREYGFAFDREIFRSTIRYSAPLIPNNFAGNFNNFANNYLVNQFINLASVGLLTVATQATNLLNSLNTGLTDAIRPWCYEKLSSNDVNQRDIYFRKMHSLMSAFSLLIAVTIFFSEEAFYLILKEQYWETWKLMPYLGCYALFNQLTSIWLIPLMYYEKGSKYVPVSTYLFIIINLGMCVFLIPRIGLVATAIAMMVSRIISSLVLLHYCRKLSGVKIKIFDFYGTPLILVLCSFLVHLSDMSLTLRLLIWAGLTVFLIIWHRNELKEFVGTFQPILKRFT
ncbi:MAG: oligosaccharide flippase family protein [Bdellovibrionota bacterium]